jgi:hypothetical protein
MNVSLVAQFIQAVLSNILDFTFTSSHLNGNIDSNILLLNRTNATKVLILVVKTLAAFLYKTILDGLPYTDTFSRAHLCSSVIEQLSYERQICLLVWIRTK